MDTKVESGEMSLCIFSERKPLLAIRDYLFRLTKTNTQNNVLYWKTCEKWCNL